MWRRISVETSSLSLPFKKKTEGAKQTKKTTSRESVYIYMNVPEMSYSIESSFVEALFLLCVETSLLGKIIFFLWWGASSCQL